MLVLWCKSIWTFLKNHVIAVQDSIGFLGLTAYFTSSNSMCAFQLLGLLAQELERFIFLNRYYMSEQKKIYSGPDISYIVIINQTLYWRHREKNNHTNARCGTGSLFYWMYAIRVKVWTMDPGGIHRNRVKKTNRNSFEIPFFTYLYTKQLGFNPSLTKEFSLLRSCKKKVSQWFYLNNSFYSSKDISGHNGTTTKGKALQKRAQGRILGCYDTHKKTAT